VTMTMPRDGGVLAREPSLEPRLESIYRQHYGFVWSTLLRLGVPAEAADDACQDVFLIVFRRLDTFEGRSQVRTWLFTIARRVAFRHRRGARRAERKANALAAEPRPHQSLEESFEKRRAADMVLHALDELDEDKRTAVVLHVFEGMSGPQIAETLGLPVDTAYSRIKAGRRVLRTRLRALGIEEDPGLYHAARRQTQPNAETGRRVAALLAARLGAAPLVTATAWKGLVAAVALGLVGYAGARALEGSSPPAPTSVAAVAPADDEQTPPPRPAAHPPQPPPLAAPPEIETTPPPVAQPKRARARTATAPQLEAADRLREEVALIGGVKAALDGGRPGDAMTRLDEHARRFPEGELTPERRGYRAIALCELGKQTEGRGTGRTFAKAHPGSTLAGRVRAACGLEEEAVDK